MVSDKVGFLIGNCIGTQLEYVSLARSGRRLHHHACPAVAAYSAEAAAKDGLAKEDLFPVATRALRPVAKDREQPTPSKPWSHSWKMFAVWAACNRDGGSGGIEL